MAQQHFDEDEWFDLARTFKPELTREEFSEMWKEFVRLKEDHQRRLLVS